MKTLLQYLGVFFVLCGVICLVVYFFALPENYLLATSLILEFVGILSYILINKFLK